MGVQYVAFALQGLVAPDVPTTRNLGTAQRKIRWIQVDS
jgi:hypothetical protein